MAEEQPALHAPDELRGLSRAALVVRLKQLEAELDVLRGSKEDAQQGIVHELQVHQVELEMQNREMQETQAALEESRGQYAELYHHAPTGYVTLDRDGVVGQANATACGMVAVRRQQVLRTLFANFLVPASRQIFRRGIDACFTDADEHSFEVMLQPSSGQPVAMQVFARRAQGRWGPGGNVHVSLINVSDRHKLDAQLKFLLAVSDALFSSFDPDVLGGRIAHLAVPFLAEAATFYPRNDPTNVEMASAPPYASRHRTPLLALTRALASSELARRLTKGGRPLHVDLDAPANEIALLDSAVQAGARELNVRTLLLLPAVSRQQVWGTIVLHQHRLTPRRSHLPAFFEDFSRRIGIALDNAQLFQRSRKESHARRNLLAVVSHDLRNPLSVVMLKGEQMVAACDKQGPAALLRLRRSADVVLRCARRMNDLIGDLLDATSMESGTFCVAVVSEDLGEVLAEAIEAAQPELVAKNMALQVEVEGGLHASCDRRRTLQVVGNILSNAAKFSDRGGSVVLRARGAGNFVLVSVADTGVGMAPAACSRAFDRFWQGGDAAHLGCGLGLSICRGIVEASGGKIWVESVEGLGSTFSFTLPRVPAASPGAGVEVSPRGEERVQS